MGEIVSMVKTGLDTVTCSFAYCVYVYVSVQKLVDKIERKTSSDISFIISIVIHVFHFLLISCCSWTLSSMVHLFINSFDFQSEKPHGPYDPNRPVCPVDVCFLYSDCEALENKSMSQSMNPDNKTIKNIRVFLEDKKIRCSIARPPIDESGKTRFRILIFY